MAKAPYVRTMPFALSTGSEVLDAPNDLVVAGTNDPITGLNVDGYWLVCTEADQEFIPAESNATGFAANDNILIEAYRIKSPFADALVNLQPRIEFSVFGMVGFVPDGVTTHDDLSAPHLFLDYSAPWGEWMEVNQFVPAWNEMGAPNGSLNKYLVIKAPKVTLKTSSLDTVYNGSILKLEIDLKVRHSRPLAMVNPVP